MGEKDLETGKHSHPKCKTKVLSMNRVTYQVFFILELEELCMNDTQQTSPSGQVIALKILGVSVTMFDYFTCV
jgi:hypothetical protein